MNYSTLTSDQILVKYGYNSFGEVLFALVYKLYPWVVIFAILLIVTIVLEKKHKG